MLEGYAWLPALRRRSEGDVVHTRVMGQRAVALLGPDAARFFYDEDHVRRAPALPEPVKSTLFGHGAVHSLDRDDHRARKAVFVSLMTPQRVAGLTEEVAAVWERTTVSWPAGRAVVLFDAAAEILTEGVCRWAGIPLDASEVPGLAADLVAMVDGFGSPGPRHWRARAARRRREEWLTGIVERVRGGAVTPSPNSALAAVSAHRDLGGQPLAARIAAVELPRST
ncbi:hypothetical protein GCM10009530_26560 [Microbispora corallina]|uniref:Cytochrome P450 n=1 Tax=Microbispora corallina TaxID=83302 RepID=A0ABQ4G4Y2_9ACTN|nr:hypothetical protein [Microbispora corallina]GIH42137.1 hypothetical protein Mco01_51370 [Microbispora corallina]